MARKRPNLIIKVDCLPKTSFGDYEHVFFHDVVQFLAKRGLSTDDIIGKRVGISFKVGARRKLKSFRFVAFEQVARCSCCCPLTEISHIKQGMIL